MVDNHTQNPFHIEHGIDVTQQDTTGLGIVLLTALADRQWVEEEDLAKNLNLPPKMVRKAMRFFEQVGWTSLRQSAGAEDLGRLTVLATAVAPSSQGGTWQLKRLTEVHKLPVCAQRTYKANSDAAGF